MSDSPRVAAADFDVRDPALLRDPYPIYARVRATAPVLWDERQRLWRFTRYAEVLTALRDPRFAADDQWCAQAAPIHPAVEPLRTEMLALRRFASHWLLFQNPPSHPRLRAVLATAFTPRVIEALRPQVESLVDGLLDAVAEQGRMELVRDLAFPLPALVIAALLGLPAEDRDQFKSWSDAIIAWVNYPAQPDVAGCVRDAHSGLQELAPYFREIIAQRKARPGADLISLLVSSGGLNESLDEDELISNCLFLLQAGHETTTGLIACGALALLRNPDQLQRLRADPALIGSAVEELLRYDSPVIYQTRVARETLELAGQTIQPGQRLILFLGAANRDPAQFPNPDRLDLGRRENRHLAFGFGPHFCLGAPLARLEAAVAIGRLLNRFGDLALETDALDWGPFGVFRCPRALPLGYGVRR